MSTAPTITLDVTLGCLAVIAQSLPRSETILPLAFLFLLSIQYSLKESLSQICQIPNPWIPNILKDTWYNLSLLLDSTPVFSPRFCPPCQNTDCPVCLLCNSLNILFLLFSTSDNSVCTSIQVWEFSGFQSTVFIWWTLMTTLGQVLLLVTSPTLDLKDLLQ